MENILPADTFIVINKTVLHEDRRILISLYQPLVGSTAINLYYTLWTYLDHFECLSDEIEHHALLNNMMITINEFNDARKRLEAVGLIKTYAKYDKINNYIYEIFSPLSASEFLNHPIFSMALMNALGEREYKKTVEFFKVPSIDLKNYQNITSKFTDFFTFASDNIREIEINNLRKKNINEIELTPKINVENIISFIPDELLNKKAVTSADKKLIINLSYIYNYDEEILMELIRNSLTDKHIIDKKLLKENALKYYEFDNVGKLPSLIYKTQPENLKNKNEGFNNNDKMIHIFECTSPYDFISSKYRSGSPSSSDLKIISYLLVDLELNPGVTNVLVDFVLKINNNKLTKAYVDTIASQWKKKNIQTVKEAMELAKEEYHKKNKKYTNNKESKIVPSWINKEYDSEEASLEEIKELERLLGD